MRRHRDRVERRQLRAAHQAYFALVTSAADLQAGLGETDLIEAAAERTMGEVLAGDPAVARELIGAMTRDLAAFYRAAATDLGIPVGDLLARVALNTEAALR